MKSITKILFVCMGNICRSPSAEGIFRTISANYPELNKLQIDSCGTIGYHEGNTADPRSISAAKIRGYDLTAIRSRKMIKNDLEFFDLILAMDKDNLNTIQEYDHLNHHAHKIKLFLEFSNSTSLTCVPDPYYGGESGFNHVIDLIEDASEGLIKALQN